MKHWQNKSPINIDGEVWKPVKGFEERYLISNKGRVKSLGSSHDTGNNIIVFKEKIRSISLDTDGYCFLNFSVKNKSYPQKIHRLVADAFIPNPCNYDTVDHEDFDRTNNMVENLRWKHRADNYLHSVSNGRMRNNGRNLPEMTKRLFSKKVIKFDLNGFQIQEYESVNEAGRQNKISHSCILANIKGKTKHSAGFLWKYKTSISS